MTYVHQKLNKTGILSETNSKLPDSNEFFLLDAAIGYRFPKRRGIVSLAVKNLLDEKFSYEEISGVLSPQIDNPQFIPDRLIFSQFTLNF